MKSKVLVTIQFLLIGLIALYAGVFGNSVQNLLMLIGILLGLWATVTMKLKVNIFPDVRENQELYISGPYRYIRHPMYAAVLLVTFSWVLHRPDVLSIGLWLLLFVVLVYKLNYEEKLLELKFKNYTSHKKKTNRLIPLIF